MKKLFLALSLLVACGTDNTTDPDPDHDLLDCPFYHQSVSESGDILDGQTFPYQLKQHTSGIVTVRVWGDGNYSTAVFSCTYFNEVDHGITRIHQSGTGSIAATIFDTGLIEFTNNTGYTIDGFKVSTVNMYAN